MAPAMKAEENLRFRAFPHIHSRSEIFSIILGNKKKMRIENENLINSSNENNSQEMEKLLLLLIRLSQKSPQCLQNGLSSYFAVMLAQSRT